MTDFRRFPSSVLESGARIEIRRDSVVTRGLARESVAHHREKRARVTNHPATRARVTDRLWANFALVKNFTNNKIFLKAAI